jgi:hypothetical protein
VTYTLSAPRGSNLSNGVTDTSAVIIGPSTYITLVERRIGPPKSGSIFRPRGRDR